MTARVVGWLAVVFTASLGANSPQPQSTGSPAPSVSPERALINRYCVTCHNAKLKTAGLTLDTIDVDKVSENTAVWEKAARKLRARAMPPAGLPRPEEASYQALVWYWRRRLIG